MTINLQNPHSEKFQLANKQIVIIEYFEDEECNTQSTRYDGKYRRITLHGKLGSETSRVEENPYIAQNFGSNLEIIDAGLSLKEIKERVQRGESYLVVIWKRGNMPLPVDLGYHKDITLKLVDQATSTKELAFNVINLVRAKRG